MGTIRIAQLDPPHGSDVYPAQPALPPPVLDAREWAVGALASWIAALRFLRTGNVGGPPIPFKIPKARVHTEWPDSVEDLKFPSIVFIPQPGSYVRSLGGGNVLDDTLGIYAPKTVVLDMGEYTERLIVEAWSSKKSERRAVTAAIETAMMMNETTMALRLRVPDYFDSTVTFSLEEQERIDDQDVARNRRRCRYPIQMTVSVLRLVHSVTLQPYVYGMDDEPLDLDTSAAP